jgi:predicted ribosome quality control (RQC) complex YloA/Tae2 family protein
MKYEESQGMSESKRSQTKTYGTILKISLAKSLKNLHRKHDKQLKELAETDRAEWYRQVADSLLANPGQVPRGVVKTLIFNVHSQQMEEVSLNPKFDYRGNAKLFYKKARKGARGEEINRKKVSDTEAAIGEHENLLRELEAAVATADDQKTRVCIVRIESLLGMPAAGTVHRSSETGPARITRIPYRHFTFNCWEVFVGKNNTQNDELSIRFARSQDLWLHVIGHPGSHVIIRRPRGSMVVPSEIIEKAASLAVWFSNAKHTSHAGVHVTEARFVHKRRHAPPGEVVAERCREVRVQPRSPQEFFPSLYDETVEFKV